MVSTEHLLELELSDSENRMVFDALSQVQQAVTDGEIDLYSDNFSKNYNDLKDSLGIGNLVLPKVLEDAAEELKGSDKSILKIENYPIDAHLGPTPTGLVYASEKSTGISELGMLIFADLLDGAPFALDTDNKGKFFRNIYPVEKNKALQSSHSSLAELTPHTEHSCYSVNPDYVCLMGLRAPYVANTKLYDMDSVESSLTKEELGLIMEPKFVTLLDHYLWEYDSSDSVPFPLVKKTAGGKTEWRYDVEYTRGLEPEHQVAMEKVAAELEGAAIKINIEEGTLVVFNNKRVMHAREAFEARYDGTDRWIQRLIIGGDRSKTYYTLNEIWP
ncbi:MAG TPA: TauD/TfdA family dioxygenase [Candidatus Saccharimonadales bacterium]